MSVLGLDISTTYTGVVVLEKNDPPIILTLDHIEFKKCKTLWDKVDVVKSYFEAAKKKPEFANVRSIMIEDPAKKFSMGKSSATTIVTLARFNGLVSYLVREVFGMDPEYIAASAARKAVGLKMQQKKKCGLTHKEQTATHIMSNDLKHITWPKKKSGEVVDWSYDVIDAFVIAKAAIILST